MNDLDLLDPLALYRVWERQPWSAFDIDLGDDRRQWEVLDAASRYELQWGMTSFLAGEQLVTRELTPLLANTTDMDELAFLCTQQVDEARHSQFFGRFFTEVLADSPPASSDQGLADGFRAMLEEQLVEAGERLATGGGSPEARADFVTIYHLLIEGTLALTAQQVIADYLTKRGLFRGLRHGLRLISRDEHRHIAYGAGMLREAARDPAIAARIQHKVAELLPLVVRALAPPASTDRACFGRTATEITQDAFAALYRRLRAIGLLTDARLQRRLRFLIRAQPPTVPPPPDRPAPTGRRHDLAAPAASPD